MIIIDRNLLDGTPDEIAEVNILAIIVNGRVVYEDAVDWSSPNTLREFDPGK